MARKNHEKNQFRKKPLLRIDSYKHAISTHQKPPGNIAFCMKNWGLCSYIFRHEKFTNETVFFAPLVICKQDTLSAFCSENEKS